MPGCLSIYNACAIRVTALDADGEPDWGADASFVVAPITVQAAPITDEPPSLLTRDGCGRVCANPLTQPTTTGFTLTGTLCKNDFELKAALFGGTVVYGSGPTAGIPLGWAAPTTGTLIDPVCIELWQLTADGENVGTINGTQQYLRRIFPFGFAQMASETYENAVTPVGFTITTGTNNQIGAIGPYDDWRQAINGPYGEQFDTSLPTIFCNGAALSS